MRPSQVFRHRKAVQIQCTKRHSPEGCAVFDTLRDQVERRITIYAFLRSPANSRKPFGRAARPRERPSPVRQRVPDCVIRDRLAVERGQQVLPALIPVGVRFHGLPVLLHALQVPARIVAVDVCIRPADLPDQLVARIIRVAVREHAVLGDREDIAVRVVGVLRLFPVRRHRGHQRRRLARTGGLIRIRRVHDPVDPHLGQARQRVIAISHRLARGQLHL